MEKKCGNAKKDQLRTPTSWSKDSWKMLILVFPKSRVFDFMILIFFWYWSNWPFKLLIYTAGTSISNVAGDVSKKGILYQYQSFDIHKCCFSGGYLSEYTSSINCYMKAGMGFLKYPKGLLMYKQVLACGREWRTRYGKRKIKSIMSCGREEIMEKIWWSLRKRERDTRQNRGR